MRDDIGFPYLLGFAMAAGLMAVIVFAGVRIVDRVMEVVPCLP